MTILFLLAYVAAIVLAVIDQLIKVWAVGNLQGQPERPFLQIGSFDWMHLRFVENDGAAFSILSGSKWFLIGFSALMIAICLILMQKLGKKHRWLLIVMPLIAGGGLGNLIDRVFRGGLVVDFLDFQLMNFAVFNFADVCVSVGVILMAICLLFVEKDEPSAKKLKKAKTLENAEQVGELNDAETHPDAEEYPDA
ncbi:MAG: signal peptidase II [Oscillospiraceae bacterium]|nr:signal peptidase II [Oscillospiraceae bacterium]